MRNEKKMNATKVITGKETVFSYLTVVEPKAPIGGGTPKYSASLIISKNDKETVQKIRDGLQGGRKQIEGQQQIHARPGRPADTPAGW